MADTIKSIAARNFKIIELILNTFVGFNVIESCLVEPGSDDLPNSLQLLG